MGARHRHPIARWPVAAPACTATGILTPRPPLLSPGPPSRPSAASHPLPFPVFAEDSQPTGNALPTTGSMVPRKAPKTASTAVQSRSRPPPNHRLVRAIEHPSSEAGALRITRPRRDDESTSRPATPSNCRSTEHGTPPARTLTDGNGNGAARPARRPRIDDQPNQRARPTPPAAAATRPRRPSSDDRAEIPRPARRTYRSVRAASTSPHRALRRQTPHRQGQRARAAPASTKWAPTAAPSAIAAPRSSRPAMAACPAPAASA